MSVAAPKKWSGADSASLYEVDRWGDGYFHVTEDSRLMVSPSRDPLQSIDLKDLVDGLTQRGLDLPILIRFNGILRDRLKRLSESFADAIEEHQYGNS